MNDLTIQPLKLSIAYSASAELMVELAKMLAIVAPTSMTTEQQELWLRAAADALDGIRADEVRSVSAELRRSVTRHNQIVPEIAKLVSEKRRSSASSYTPNPYAAELRINREAQERRGKAKTQQEIEDAWQWERDARQAAGLYVRPLPKPLSAGEVAALSPSMVKMGLKCGALTYRNGRLVDIGESSC